MSRTTSEQAIVELVYDTSGDIVQMWRVDGPVTGTFNRALDDDGLYEIVLLDAPDVVVGWEIVSFRHYASVHQQWRPIADAFARLPGGSLIWREPSPGAGLQQLVHA